MRCIRKAKPPPAAASRGMQVDGVRLEERWKNRTRCHPKDPSSSKRREVVPASSNDVQRVSRYQLTQTNLPSDRSPSVLERPRDIRKLIERNRAELEQHFALL
jgi:hypothetical protein